MHLAAFSSAAVPVLSSLAWAAAPCTSVLAQLAAQAGSLSRSASSSSCSRGEEHAAPTASTSGRAPSAGQLGLGLVFRRGMCRWLGESPHIKPSAIPGIKAQPAPNSNNELEVRMDSKVVFDSCWRRFEEKYRLKSIHVPREVVWLNGAPGAGKGANTQHIMKIRGVDHVICISSQLLSSKEAITAIERGEMIPDTLVGDMLLEGLLIHSCQAPECGVLVDGFPRTALQVDFLKLLYDKLNELHGIWLPTPHRDQFPRPLFKVVMLYVDEETSISRQMERARVASLHNKRVMDAGAGELWKQRTTDLSIETCKKRYDIFRQHYSATMRLKQFFPFHLIDAMGSLAETQEAITTELRYQSSLDLSYETYSAIRHLPLARDLSQHARQQLVMRLDNHCHDKPDIFQKVISLITTDLMPHLKESGLSGRSEYVTENRLFTDNPVAAQMVIDILTDRGYSVSHATDVTHVPVSFDLQTGQIKTKKEVKHKFNVIWDTNALRDTARAMEIATRMAEVNSSAVKSVHISQSFIPQALDRESKRQLSKQQEPTVVPAISSTTVVVPSLSYASPAAGFSSAADKRSRGGSSCGGGSSSGGWRGCPEPVGPQPGPEAFQEELIYGS